MHIPATQAVLFAIFVLPICLYTVYTDLKYKKITNLTVWALFATFVVVGFFTMPLVDFAWRFSHWAIVFGIGLVLWFRHQMGAGDVKFGAVMALFIHPGDLPVLLWVAVASLIGATIAILLAGKSPLRKLAPDWAAWTGKHATVGQGKKFTVPMGPALCLTLATYLVLGLLNGQ
jgi:prepilin peptidase CpaA